jgi:hypothetical protein
MLDGGQRGVVDDMVRVLIGSKLRLQFLLETSTPIKLQVPDPGLRNCNVDELSFEIKDRGMPYFSALPQLGSSESHGDCALRRRMSTR